MPGRALTHFRGQWHEGNPKIAGPLTHAFWMASVVFDGARAFEGVTPDLYLHCERLITSARAMELEPVLSAGEVMELTLDGVARFDEGASLYLRPMFYAEDGFVDAYPESTQFVLTIAEAPMPEPTGASACLSSRRRPTPECAITDAKASSLYPNNGLAIREAKARGFKNAIMLDLLGHVAEFATANLFIAKDGAVHTPAPNRTFLNGITRKRVIQLLRDDGVEVVERAITADEVLAADEVFSTGNYAKVLPFTRIEDRDLQPGPFYARARKLYWDFAHS
jgi:branched-chain amino acid aminotransferase